MKKLTSLLLAAVMLLSFAACSGSGGKTAEATQEPTEAPLPTAAPTAEPTQDPDANKISVPDVIDIEEADARNVISSIGLIPYVVSEYNDTYPKGHVFMLEPSAGTKCDLGTKVTIHISMGPSRIGAKDSHMYWTFITNGKADDWHFDHPYIEEGYLYIDCYEVTFGTAMEWRDRYNEGYASGTASINDSFDKVVPVKLEYDGVAHEAGEKQHFTIVVPLADLGIDRPTDMYFLIGIRVNGKDTNLKFNISMTW